MNFYGGNLWGAGGGRFESSLLCGPVLLLLLLLLLLQTHLTMSCLAPQPVLPVLHILVLPSATC